GTAARSTPRARFAAGVILAILLGFVPAHLIAAAREDAAFRAIDAQIEATQRAATTADMYAQLDKFRAAQLARKESERQMIALTPMLIWAPAGAGPAYLWFRRIPWDQLGARPA